MHEMGMTFHKKFGNAKLLKKVSGYNSKLVSEKNQNLGLIIALWRFFQELRSKQEACHGESTGNGRIM